MRAIIDAWRRYRLRKAKLRYEIACAQIAQEESYLPTIYPTVMRELVMERIQARSEVEYLMDKLGMKANPASSPSPSPGTLRQSKNR